MWRYLLCSFALVLLYPTAIDLYLVGLPQIALDLNATEPQLHIAFSIYLAGMATTMLFAGRVADTVGRKPVAIVGAIIFTCAAAWGGAAETTQTFLIARFLQGIGAGACYIVAFAILRDTLDDQRRAKVLSMLNGITCIIPVIAPVIGHLIMLKYPWPSLFMTMAGIGILVCLLSVFILRESKPAFAIENAKAELATLENQPAESHESFVDPYFISRLVLTSLGVISILTYVNISPMLLMNMMGFDRGEYSSAMALLALISMVSSFITPIALARFQQQSVLLFSQYSFLMAAVVLTASYINAWDNVMYLIGLGFICMGFAAGFGVAMSQALSPFSQRAGVASSLLGIAQVCGSGVYIWLMGMLGVSALAMLIIILAIGGLISLALILLINPANRKNLNEQITRTS